MPNKEEPQLADEAIYDVIDIYLLDSYCAYSYSAEDSI
jgi:hypothetical protein